MLLLDRRRFLFVTGKGGSGKTTVSAALALALASRGQRVLVATSGAKERISALLGAPGLTTSVELLRQNLWGVLLTPEVAFREYGTLVLRSKKLVEALFDNKYVEGLFNGAPGLREWALLGKAWYHAIETQSDGSPRFDVVVFDAPATGHGLEMLRVPQVIIAAAPPGRLRSDAERALGFLRDPKTSAVIVVTLLEEMPTNETLELVEALNRELLLPIGQIVANASLEVLFTQAEGRQLEPFAESDSEEPGEAALAAAARRALAERTQNESLARLAATALPILHLPRLEAAGTPETTRQLSELLHQLGG